MARLTLLEVNLDGAEFTANAPFSGSKDAETDEERDQIDVPEAPTSERGGPSVAAFVVGLLAAAVAVATVRRLLSRRRSRTDDEDAEIPLAAD